MAYTHNITANDPLYQNAARTLTFTVYTDDTTDEEIAAGAGTIQDCSGYAMRWQMMDRNGQKTVRITKATGSGIVISGVFNASPAVNTQHPVVTLNAADVVADPDTYDHGLRRTDAGNETPLSTGTAVVKAAP